MVKVKNAIILAAGRGSRLKHLTEETPKPLLAPKGTPFIIDIIQKLKEKGINDIVVVTGYKSEKFDFLKDEVTLVENKNWNNGNNVTSIVAAIDYVGDSLIVNGDIIMKENVFETEYPSSLTYVEENENIDEWIVNLDENNQVIGFDKEGLGKQGLYQREITFVSQELANDIKQELEHFDMEEYQEYLMMNTANKNNIDFKIHKINANTVFDLDTVKEYEDYVSS